MFGVWVFVRVFVADCGVVFIVLDCCFWGLGCAWWVACFGCWFCCFAC